ncbi:LLM class F420-dependent oxidoreductase [Phycicoccus sonneratiae]|uniref:LLM class F420-dependent oxidoreductase n=1 Tax=Phycicoccus sonneratiae TaxID=2807628 RepID=A0ABS2CIM3_9MICO|nr:LLM class F420-dependent oxidoreductase [Phycicoccus sonneraticus]MBM6399625.1 LLM class F420-dependent oxidoreductase [Phycicoccus sonneraticus]
MRLGLQVSRFSWEGAPASTGATWRAVARDADQAGLASLWVMDHFFQMAMAGSPEDDMLEGYTTLAHAAAVTERIELGTLVTGATYRHPGILLKTVTTLDVLSGGRAWLGIGAGWYEEEHLGLGVPFPSTRERFEVLEDTLRLAHRMFADDDRPFEGRVVRAERPLNHPQPVRRPPIMVGGGGERKTLRLVAQYADACNLFDTGLGPEGIPRKLEVLRGHCEDVGRPYDEISKTCLARLTMDAGSPLPEGVHGHSVEEAVDRLGRLREAGIDHVIASMANTTDPAAHDLLAEVVRRVG